MGDLVERNDVWYKKFTDVPFTGKVTGQIQGRFKDGRRDGVWRRYHDNGQLWQKGNFKDGKKEGLWENYYDNGQLYLKENYKDGKLEGLWERYHDNGQLFWKENYKDGKRISCEGDYC